MELKKGQVKFEYNGKWFLPSNPGEKITGKLTIDSNSAAILHLIGRFSILESDFQSTPIILGKATNGAFITLYKCTGIFYREGFNDTYETDWSVSVIIKGAHFESAADLLFNKASIELVHLDEWLSATGFHGFNFDRTKCEFEIRYKLPKRIDYNYHDKFLFGFDFSMTSPKYESTLDFKQTAHFFLFNGQQPLHIDKILDYITNFRDFLAFATFQPTQIQGFVAQSEQVVTNIFGKQSMIPIKVFFVNHTPLLPTKQPFRFLFTHQDMHEGALLAWFENITKLRPVIDLLLDYISSQNPFTEQKFINIIQAVETFHRRKRGGTELPEADHQKRCEAIINAVSEEYRGFIKEKLKYSNESSLRKRLKELIKEFDCATLQKVIPDFRSFITKVVENRNYYTHYGEDKESIAADRGELFRLTEKLKVILTFSCLSELGFQKQESEKFLGEHLYRFCRAIG